VRSPLINVVEKNKCGKEKSLMTRGLSGIRYRESSDWGKQSSWGGCGRWRQKSRARTKPNDLQNHSARVNKKRTGLGKGKTERAGGLGLNEIGSRTKKSSSRRRPAKTDRWVLRPRRALPRSLNHQDQNYLQGRLSAGEGGMVYWTKL